jgi:hypothetical protein
MRLTRAFWSITIVLFTFSTAGAVDKDGFRGFKWGTELNTFLENEQKSEEGVMGAVPGVQAFRLKNEDLNIGGIKADSIVYCFFNGKLTTVAIDFKSFDKMEKLVIFCKKHFGPATGPVTMRSEYYMSFDTPKTGVLLLYQLSLVTASYGRMYLYSKEHLAN